MTDTFSSLRRRKDFLACYKKGKSFSSCGIRLKAIPVNEGIIKLGFSISASTGNAVQRNRARRRLKNALREILSEGVYKPFTGIFFINAVKVNRMAWRELLNALKNIFKNTSDNCLKYKVKDL